MPQLENPKQLPLTGAAEEILETMFAAHRRVVVRSELGGGFSGSQVLLVHPISDAPELPTVVKIAPAAWIEKEYQAYQEFIHEKLSGAAEIRSAPVLTQSKNWGGLRYHLVGSGIFKVESLLNFIQHAGSKDVWHVLEKRLFARIAPLWRFSTTVPQFSLRASYDALLPVNLLLEAQTAAAPEAQPLLAAHQLTPAMAVELPLQTGDLVQLSGFVVEEVGLSGQSFTLNAPPTEDAYRLRVHLKDSPLTYRPGTTIESLTCRVMATRYELLRDQVERALGEDYATAPTLSRSDKPGGTWPNPFLALPAILKEARNVRVAVIHGDLNLENVLVDGDARDVSLIDFALARRDHVLHDLLRLETGMVTRFLPQILATAHLPPETICDLYEQMHHALHRPGHLSAPQELPSILGKPFIVLATIRGAARECLYDPEQWEEYYQGLTFYLLGALKFTNLDEAPHAPLPKQVAFWGAAAAQKLRNETPRYDDKTWQSFAVILDDLTGQTLGQYAIVNFAGQGSMGTVYRARQSRLQRDVAIKVMSPALANDTTFCRRFEREAQFVANLRHPNILAVHDYGEMEDGRPYLVVDYVKGGTLRDRLLAAQQTSVKDAPGTNTLQLQEAIEIAAQVADALQYAHDRGIIHRDVKPNNILLDENGHPLLSDFGLAKPIKGDRRLTGTGVIVGTPDYMAPEQAQESHVDGRADIYALGVVLFEMLVGRHPFSGETPIGVIIKHINEPLPRPGALNPAIPPWLDEVVAKATAKHPEERYQSAGELACALRAGPSQLRASSTPAEMAIAPPPQAQLQKKLWIWGWILAAIVVIALGGWWIGNAMRSTPTPADPPPTRKATATEQIAVDVQSLATAQSAPTRQATKTIQTVLVSNLTWQKLYDGAGFVYGAITAMVVSPQDAELVYAGVKDAGIYRSKDGGASWEQMYGQLDNSDLCSLKHDIAEPQTLLARTCSGHLYQTQNDGRDWTEIIPPDVGEERRIDELELDVLDAQHLYIGMRITNDEGASSALYESWDKGKSWSKRGELYLISDLAADPQDGQRIFILGREESETNHHVYRSDEPGYEWKEVWSGDENTLGLDLEMVGNNLYLAGGDQLLHSLDAGENWTRIAETLCYGVYIAPYDADVLYCWDMFGIQARISQDGGKTWSDREPIVGVAAFAPDQQTVYANCYLGLLKSPDRGKTWQLKPGASIAKFEIHVSDHNERTLYAVDRDGSVKEELYKSTDGGQTWQMLTAPKQSDDLIINQTTGILHRFDQYGEGIYRSTDAGQTWTTFSMPGESISDLDMHDASNILYAIGNEAYLSKDDGVTWNKISGSWPDSTQIHSQGMLDGMLYVVGYLGAARISQSTDGGQHWKECGLLDEAQRYLDVADIIFGGEQVFLAVENGGVWISTDECTSWQEHSDGLGSPVVNALAQHPARPAELYAATDAGVYILHEGEQKWETFSAGLPQADKMAVHDLAFSPNQPYTLYAATLQGVFALEIP
ncbi:MAG: protein kinase [Anaerolineae bacterium]|nr:protein kinase [Anaerolineae bacterium]